MFGREVVIVDAVRTPIGRGHAEKGALRDSHPTELLGACFSDVIRRADVDAGLVEDVLAGCVQQIGEQGYGVARNAWLAQGLPIETAASTIERQCGSGQQAVNFAAAQIAVGAHDVMIGAGVEMMSRIPITASEDLQQSYGPAWTPQLLEHHALVGQGLGAELIAEERGITRGQADALAVRSHALAADASDSEAFTREIVPIGDVTADQGIRRGTSLESLAALRPVFKGDGVVTAGTASQISDGAAAVLLASRDAAERHGLAARARIVDQIAVGVDPVKMLEGPIPATRKILARQDMTIDDIDLFEVNEAFAPVVLAWQQELGADPDRVNVRGGAMALGHPLGGSGARLITTLLHAMEDRSARFGLVTMCCGGGLGTATLIERL